MHLRSIKHLLTIFILVSFSTGTEEAHYSVSVWSIPIVDITLNLTDPDKNNQITLEFHTETTPLASLFFDVDNHYTTKFIDSTYQMIRYEKEIKQPNIKQNMTIFWDDTDSSFHYEDLNYHRKPITHNIFSVLMRGRYTDWEELDTKWLRLDHEGTPYQARYLWIDSTEVVLNGRSVLSDHFRFDIIPTDDEQEILVEKTDVFTWGIVLNGCIRQIWIERSGKKRILRAEVKVKGWTLIAELKD